MLGGGGPGRRLGGGGAGRDLGLDRPRWTARDRRRRERRDGLERGGRQGPAREALHNRGAVARRSDRRSAGGVRRGGRELLAKLVEGHSALREDGGGDVD